MRRRASLVGMTFAFLCSTPMLLLAQTPGPSSAQAQATGREAEARELFQQGREVFKQGDWRRALNLFQKSQEIYPAPGTLLNVASCEEKLGLVASAWEHFQRVVAELPATDARVAIARERSTALEPRVPRVRLSLVPRAPAGTTITRNGVVIPGSSLGTEMRIDPGEHEVVVTAPGWPARRYKLTLSEGKRVVAVLKPGSKTEDERSGGAPRTAEELSEPEKPPPAPSAINGKRTAGLVIGGIGLVGLGIGGATGIMAIVMNNKVKELCPMPKQCTTEGVAIGDMGQTMATVSTVSLAAGLAGVGGGIALLILSSGDESKSTTAFGPVLLTGGAGVGVQGRF